MGKPYSLDLRKRVVAAIEAGMSRNRAAKQFGIAISTAIGWMERMQETGSVAPGRWAVTSRRRFRGSTRSGYRNGSGTTISPYAGSLPLAGWHPALHLHFDHIGSIRPTTVLGSTVSPSFAKTLDSSPVTGVRISWVTLSVSISTSGSYTVTGSPTRLNHRPIDSLLPALGIVGTFISVIAPIL